MAEERELKWYGWGVAGKEYDLSRRNNFWPYLTERLQLTGNEKSLPVNIEDIRLPPSDIANVAAKLDTMLGSSGVRDDDFARITHSMGKSYYDLIRIRRGLIDHPPDIVVYPQTITQVLAILQFAAEKQIALIPFGGGTSVVGGVEAIRGNSHTAAISLDMSCLNKVLEVDPVSMLATIEAGIRGPALEAELQKRGFTLGHYPQSFEFSTLGGWVATRSAGQQSNRYGKIEDMVSSITLVTPAEVYSTNDAPASAAGPSLKQLLIGSEGLFGVITRAKLRINPLPETKVYRGILFKDFIQGVEAIRAIVQSGLEPTTIRLSDQAETEAIMKMRAESESVFESALTNAGRWYLKNRGYQTSTSLMILGFEEKESKAKSGMKSALDICKQFDGIDIGRRVGELWYKDRFETPYLRDTLLDHAIMIDTLETATTWHNLPTIYQKIETAVKDALKSFKTPPLVFCHISHSYNDGASLYFTFIAKQAVGVEAEQWQAVKVAASDAIVANGATITHHHGVGRDHSHWAKIEHGKTGMLALSAVKKVFDPSGILNPGKFL